MTEECSKAELKRAIRDLSEFQDAKRTMGEPVYRALYIGKRPHSIRISINKGDQ